MTWSSSSCPFRAWPLHAVRDPPCQERDAPVRKEEARRPGVKTPSWAVRFYLALLTTDVDGVLRLRQVELLTPTKSGFGVLHARPDRPQPGAAICERHGQAVAHADAVADRRDRVGWMLLDEDGELAVDHQEGAAGRERGGDRLR